MSPEEKEMLKRCLDLAEENNSILHSMRRSMRFARIMSILYWVVIIGSAVGAFYLIQPYMEQVTSLYGGAKSNFDDLGGLKDLLNSL